LYACGKYARTHAAGIEYKERGESQNEVIVEVGSDGNLKRFRAKHIFMHGGICDDRAFEFEISRLSG
jgi:hypothetical protein